MEKIKAYKRWPRQKIALQKRLFKICSGIDHILKTDFPYDSLIKDEKTKKLYDEKFWGLFQKTEYPWDKEPLIKFGFGHICCSTTITRTFYVKGRNEEMIEC